MSAKLYVALLGILGIGTIVTLAKPLLKNNLSETRAEQWNKWTFLLLWFLASVSGYFLDLHEPQWQTQRMCLAASSFAIVVLLLTAWCRSGSQTVGNRMDESL